MSVEAETVRAHVERIAESAVFAGAERMCRFLRYTVDAMLAGKAELIKEYTIGRDVFDRGAEYDTRIDPIVRVEARRLRSRLAEYYSGPGQADVIRIEYPKGSYVPTVSASPLQSAPRSFPWLVAAAGTIAIASTAFLFLRPATVKPELAPVPLQWIESGDSTLEPSAVPLAEAIDAALANEPSQFAVAWPTISREPRGESLQRFAAGVSASELVAIVVRREAGTDRVVVFLIDEPADRKRLARTYFDAALSSPEELSRLAARIAKDLSPPTGPARSN